MKKLAGILLVIISLAAIGCTTLDQAKAKPKNERADAITRNSAIAYQGFMETNQSGVIHTKEEYNKIIVESTMELIENMHNIRKQEEKKNNGL
jgi:hypothetical protein